MDDDQQPDCSLMNSDIVILIESGVYPQLQFSCSIEHLVLSFSSCSIVLPSGSRQVRADLRQHLLISVLESEHPAK